MAIPLRDPRTGKFLSAEQRARLGEKEFKRLQKLAEERAARKIKVELYVGWFDAENASKATFNEYGTSRIPERAFIRPTIDTNQNKYLEQASRDVERMIFKTGAVTPAAMTKTALMIRNDLIKAIISLREPPNAPSTVERKGSSNPLVDTGEMQRAIQIKATASDQKRAPGGGS